jgi:hypothetical protein
MLSQRRILSLINLFAAQGLVLFMATVLVAMITAQAHLYWSAAVTLLLKVFLLPWILHRLIRRLNVKWDVETLVNIPTLMIFGLVLVISPSTSPRRSRCCRHGDALDARHRARLGAAFVPDDDHPLQGVPQVVAFLRWKTACSSPPRPRSTACRWWWSSASRSTCWSPR